MLYLVLELSRLELSLGQGNICSLTPMLSSGLLLQSAPVKSLAQVQEAPCGALRPGKGIWQAYSADPDSLPSLIHSHSALLCPVTPPPRLHSTFPLHRLAWHQRPQLQIQHQWDAAGLPVALPSPEVLQMCFTACLQQLLLSGAS